MPVSKNKLVCLLLSPSTRGSVLCDRKQQGCLSLLQASHIATQGLRLSPKVAEIEEHCSYTGSHATEQNYRVVWQQEGICGFTWMLFFFI